jgi:hypothetical protein
MRSRPDANNHANQMNPNNAAYWSSRGVPQPAAPPPGPGGSATPQHAPAPATPPPAPAPTRPSTTT